MKGSEFARVYGPKGYVAWENAALEMAMTGSVIAWPLVPVTFDVDDRRVTVQVTSDYFAVGETDDYLRLPLTPQMAQRIANLQGLLLPTPKIVLETWRAAATKLEPIRMSPNKGASMAQFVEHNALIDAQLRAAPNLGLRSGHKKDVVMGDLYKPGKVLIYGWMKPDAPMNGIDKYPSKTEAWRIQPYSNIHGDFYFDYSHGIRFLAPTLTIDGVPHDMAETLLSKTLAKLVSDEGALKVARYPAPGAPKPGLVASLLTPTRPSYAAYGLRLVRDGHVT